MIRKPCCSRFSLHKFVHLKFFGPNSKTCTCEVRAARGRVSWGLTVLILFKNKKDVQKIVYCVPRCNPRTPPVPPRCPPPPMSPGASLVPPQLHPLSKKSLGHRQWRPTFSVFRSFDHPQAEADSNSSQDFHCFNCPGCRIFNLCEIH